MQDMTDATEALLDLDYPEWLAEMEARGEDDGFFERLGSDHHAHFTETEGGALLVSFESFGTIRALSDSGLPLGREIADAEGWSHLALVSRRDTWFRAEEVFGFFDQLLDDGFFDDFDRVLFYGAGAGGYAACAFSVAAPGARVLALNPQATLDPRVTEWDPRFVHMRRADFTSRYGYAPEMLDAAARATVIYDPREPLDAMHAALFARPGVTRLRMPSMGGALQSELVGLDIHRAVVADAMSGELDTLRFARAMRARRDYATYLRRLLGRLEADERTGLVKMLCRNVIGRMNAPRFRRRLEALEAADAPSPRPADMPGETETLRRAVHR